MLKRILDFKFLFLFLVILLLEAGFLISALNQEKYSYDLKLAKEYAPNFWFDSEEKYYPCSPLDFYYDENLNEISGEIVKQNYDKLSLEEKLKYFKVFYEIKEKSNEIIIEYWLFYVFNEFANEHYGDWESVFVFVDKNTKKINKIIGSAHIGSKSKIILANNELRNPSTNHVNILVEKGSHANCPDGNGNGLFERKDLSNWYNSYSYYFFKWAPEDKINGVRINSGIYRLYSLVELKRILKEKKQFKQSPGLGVFLFKIGKKQYYLPIGGKPSDLASIEDKVDDPRKIEPITGKFVKERFSKFTLFLKKKAKRTGESIKNKLTEIKKIISYFLPFQKAEISQFSSSIEEKEVLKEKKEEFKKERQLNQEKQQREVFEKKNLEKKDAKKQKKKENWREIREQEIRKIEKQAKKISEKLTFLDKQISSLGKSQPYSKEKERKESKKEKQVKQTEKKREKRIPSNFIFPMPTRSLDETPPLVSLDHSLKDETIFLFWKGEDENEILNYDLEYKKGNEDWKILLERTQKTETTFLGENGETFYFRVRARDNFGNLSNWQEISVKIEKISDHLVINRVQISPSEYVELYNPTEEKIDLSNFYFSYYPAGRECQENLENCRDWSDPWLNKKFPQGEIIEPDSFYLIKVGEDEENKGEIEPDWQFKNEQGKPFSPKLNDKFGAIAIFPINPKDSTEEELKENYIDIFSWGFSQKVREGESFLDFEEKDVSKKIFIRKKDGLDTDDNLKDFIFSSEKELRNSKKLKIWINNLSPKDEFLISKPKFTLFWKSIDPKLDHYKVEYKRTGTNWRNFYEGKEESKEFISEKDFVIYSFKILAFDGEGKVSKEKEIKINFATLPVSFNEIMYNPKDPDDFCEYIEIFNNTSLPIDLTQWKLKIKNKEVEIGSFDGSSLILPPYGFALVGDDKENIFNSPECSYNIPENVLKLVVKEANLTLPNRGQGNLTLLDSQGITIDSLSYGNWWGANGDGNSLQKPKPTHYSYLRENWEPLSPSPGLLNENFDSLSLNTIDSSFSYKIFENNSYIFSEKVSPYLIKRDFRIPKEKTLIIEEGVKIFFDPGTGPRDYAVFTIEGELKVLGRKKKEVLFDSSKENSFWGGIFFRKGSKGRIEFVRISKAGRINRGSEASYMFKYGQSILIEEGEVEIKNLTLERNRYSGVVIKNSSPKIENCKIHLLEGESPLKSSAAIYIENGEPKIRECEIIGNSYGIYATDHSFPEIKETFFKENKYPLYIKNSSFLSILESNFQQNKINGIILSGLLPSGEIIFQKQNSPYIIDKTLSVSKETILTIFPGTIIKFNTTSDPYNKSAIIIEGKISAQGTEEKPIVFTSLKDDLEDLKNINGKTLENYFSDTNSDGNNTFPSPSDWGTIFLKEGSEGIFDNVILRYGGQGGWSWPAGVEINRGGLEIERANLILRNSIIENNLMAGLYLKDVDLFNFPLEKIIFRNHNLSFGYNNTSSSGLRTKNVIPFLKDCVFEGNLIDIWEGSGSCQKLIEILNNCQNCHFKEGGKFFPSSAYCFQ